MVSVVRVSAIREATMGVLGKLFRRGESHRTAEAQVECPHTALTPRWDALEDIGKEERVTTFKCESCGTTLTGDEGRSLLHQRSISTAG
jgi:hypothetical protein